MSKMNTLDIELKNMALDFSAIAESYNMNEMQLYEMLPNYLMKYNGAAKY